MRRSPRTSRKIMWEGPKETLTLTENAQPALMAVSMAVMRVLEREKGFSLKDKVKFVAGHSLGEYSALAAAGAFSLADAARLLKLRGQAMQAAVPGRAGRHDGAARRRHRCRAQGGRGRRAGRRLPGRQRQRADAGRAVGRTSRRSTACPRSARRTASAARCRCRSPHPSIAR